MNGYQFTVLHLTLAVTYLHWVQPCIYKARHFPAKELIMEGPWTDAPKSNRVIDNSCGMNSSKYKLKIPGNKQSQCGIETNTNHSSSWILLIGAKGNRSNSSSGITCIGTVINSNFVATSHTCLRRFGKHLNVYDAWNISSEYKNILRYDLAYFSNLDLDLLLLKIRADFTTHKSIRPICIPEDSDDIDLIGQLGFYVSSSHVYDGNIFTTRMCDNNLFDIFSERAKDDQWSPLCLRWWAIDISLSQAPRSHGGPLILHSLAPGQPRASAFMAGIACNKATRLSGTGADYVYFTNILPLLKYVDYQALRHKSRWCKASKLALKKINKNSTSGRAQVWEMDSVQAVIENREESLDCVCGVPNIDLGRITGARSVNPYEFGWMVIIYLYHFGRGDERKSFCGGTIINDRMILTAAHCMIHDSKLTNEALSFSQLKVKPEDIDLTMDAHKRENDPHGSTTEVEVVLIHPAYLPARKQ